MDDLIQLVKNIVGDPLPANLINRFEEEGITRESLVLLSENDLKDLGFTLGPRKLMLQWFKTNEALNSNAIQSTATQSLSGSSSPSSLSRSNSLSSLSSLSGSANSDLTAHRRTFQGCNVEELLLGQSKSTVNVPDVVARLKEGGYTRDDRIYVIKIIGRHLMENAKTTDKPTKGEKLLMVQSLLTSFPHLKETMGSDAIYDPVTHTGHLEAYIRCRRSRNASRPNVQRNQRRPPAAEVDHNPNDEVIRLMREAKPNSVNKEELIAQMAVTRPRRRAWINAEHPSITDVITTYPRFIDMEEVLTDEFLSVVDCERSLKVEWNKYKDRVLEIAASRPSASSFIRDITDQYNEDERSKMSFKCLLVMLPWCPRKGVKRPRLSPDVLTQQLCRYFSEDDTVSTAMAVLKDEGVTQPTLFCVGSTCSYYIKLDHQCLRLTGASCFSEALEMCFRSSFVFGVAYPDHLSAFYTFIEKLLGINHSKNSALVNDLFRAVTSENAAF